MLKLYVYDHCPYCVKARMIFGLKHIPVQLETILNDDVDTPTSMIGQKMVPILAMEDGDYMPESMDIVRYVDENYGDSPILGPSPSNPGLEAVRSGLRAVLYKLAMPRWVNAPLEEFATQGAKDYFTKKKEDYIGSFDENLAKTDEYLVTLESVLEQCDTLIQSDDAVHGQLTEDDIHLFADLRSLSIVKGISYPQKVESYRQTMADKCNIPLHDKMAL